MKKSEEIKHELLSSYPVKVEIHAHTSPASGCSQIPPREEVRTFHDDGYDAIAITNHFYVNDRWDSKEEYLEAYKKDFLEALDEGEKLGMKVYLGAELRFVNENGNDYLLFGITLEDLDRIYSYLDKDFETFVRECKTDKMFFLQAHPFREDMVLMNTDLLDGVEAFNMHPNHNSKVTIAYNYAKEHGKVATIGSDYHHRGHDNLSATRFKVLPNDSIELARELKNDDFIYEISGNLMV